MIEGKLAPKLSTAQRAMNDSRDAFVAYRKSRDDLAKVLRDEAMAYCPTSTDHLLITNTPHETCFSFHMRSVLLDQLNRFKVDHNMYEINLDVPVTDTPKTYSGYVNVVCTWVHQ